MSLVSHFVFATTASFSHAPPVVNLALRLLTFTQDLCISVILHTNNLEYCSTLAGKHPQEVKDRLRLVPCGEKTSMKDASVGYMAMVNKSGEAYAGILMNPTWPKPTVFIFDITSFFYVHVKAAVEAQLKVDKPPKLVAYQPQPVGDLLLYAGSEEKGSLRWVSGALDKFDPEAREIQKSEHSFAAARAQGKSAAEVLPKGELLARLVKAVETEVTNSNKAISLPGYPSMQLRERWSSAIDWTTGTDLGWFDYLAGLQSVASLPSGYITCFPADVLEPEVLELCRTDKMIGGKEGGFFEALGWFENTPGKEWEGDEVKRWLDGKGEREVVYVSFGTIVEAGEGLPVLFAYLEDSKTPFIYAGGNQKATLPRDVQDILAKAEREGRCLAPEWVDQVGVSSHPSIMCFVSHCGANSTIEGILAGVPITAWARRGDQIFNSTLLHDRQLGYSLLQQRSGHAIGKDVPSRPGEVVRGTDEAIREELEKAFALVRGKEGEVMRGRLREIGNEMRERRKGVWDQAVREFGKWGRD